MFDQCWANVVDGGPTFVKHWVDMSRLMGSDSQMQRREHGTMLFSCWATVTDGGPTLKQH